jgi:hypothetical protein
METTTSSILDKNLADVGGLERQASEYEEMADRYQLKAAAIRQIIAGVRALNGDAEGVLLRSFQSHRSLFETRPLDAKGPRGPRAVQAVMEEHPLRRWKVVDVKREMLRRGWAPSPKAVEASIRRLRIDGDLIPAGYGHYKLAPTRATPRSVDQEVLVA